MDWKERLHRLLSWQAVSGWGFLALFAWNLIAQINIALAAPSVIAKIWNFFLTPPGLIVLFLLGFVWLGLLVAQPDILKNIIGKRPQDSVQSRQEQYEARIDGLLARASGLAPQINPETIIPKVVVRYIDADFADVAMGQRRIGFHFVLDNHSDYAIRLQNRATGFIDWGGIENITYPYWLLDMRGDLIPKDESGDVYLTWIVDEHIATSFAWKSTDTPGKGGVVELSFVGIKVKLEALESTQNQWQLVGEISPPDQYENVLVPWHTGFDQLITDMRNKSGSAD